MLSLTDLATWARLSAPFGNAADLPGLLQLLQANPTTELLDEICREVLYHQGSLYQGTFAALPYLVALTAETPDEALRWHSFLNIGLLLAQEGAVEYSLRSVFHETTLPATVVDDIRASYLAAFAQLKPLGAALLPTARQKDDSEKSYFMCALAVADEQFQLSQLLEAYHDNDEYLCQCPHCETGLYAWNQDARLVLYTEDPVFHKGQPGTAVVPRPADAPPGPAAYEWLRQHSELLKISALQAILPCLGGTATCPRCRHGFAVLEGILRTNTY